MLFCLSIVSIISVLLLCPAPCACDRTICSNCSVTTTCPCGVLHISPTSFAPLSFHSNFSCSPACFCCSLIISSGPLICMHSGFLAIWALVKSLFLVLFLFLLLLLLFGLQSYSLMWSYLPPFDVHRTSLYLDPWAPSMIVTGPWSLFHA